MELNTTLVKLQGALRNVASTKYEKIKYKGGNEEKISRIVEIIRGFLLSNKFLIEDKANPEYAQELTMISGFLIVNTKFNNEGVLEVISEYMAFINAMEKLSICVLANLIIELDIAKYCNKVISTLPLVVCEEILSEIVICLKHCDPKKTLSNTYIFIDAVLKILLSLDEQQRKQNDESIDKINDIVNEMVKNISGLNPERITKWKSVQLNEHIGHALLSFLKLLNRCPSNFTVLNRISDSLIRYTIEILKAVTINMFCTWAEVRYEYNQPLQIVIGGEAFRVIEGYQKYKPASELVQMLGNIARKPKTLPEIILESDIETIINNIDKCDANQNDWFKGFMNTNVLKSETCLVCLDKWAHLCSQEDVGRLLNMSVHYKDTRRKELVIKCAKALTVRELAVVSESYFREHSSDNLDMGNVKNEMTLLLNKEKSNLETNDTGMIKDIFLLFLQNPEYVTSTLFLEGLKKSVYFQKIFESMKDTLQVHDIAKNVFWKLLQTSPPTMENIANYKEFLNMLLKQKYFDSNTLLCDIFKRLLGQFTDEENPERLVCALQLLNSTLIELILHNDHLPVLELLCNILEQRRCHFFTFSIRNQEIIQEVVDLLLKFKHSASSILIFRDFVDKLQIVNPINKFYLACLYDELEYNFLTYAYPKFNIDNEAESIGTMIKLLPTCVTSEWILFTKHLEKEYGYEKTLTLLQNTLTILCQMTKSQSKNTQKNVNNGLRFCLCQYGIVVKDVLQPKYTSATDGVFLAKSICSILKDVPINIGRDEGLQLVGLLSEQVLHSLKDDKQFVLLLVAIQDATISQLLAQKMLS